MFATFALGTALGDLTSLAMGFGYLTSGIFFAVLILIPALAWWKLGLAEVQAFRAAYVLTRPLGASFADYIAKPAARSGAGFGEGRTVVVLILGVILLVGYLTVRRPDIREPQA